MADGSGFDPRRGPGGPGPSGPPPQAPPGAGPYSGHPHGYPYPPPPGYAPPGYGHPGMHRVPPEQQQTSVHAIISLILGLFGLLPVLPIIPSIIAMVLASTARKEIQEDPYKKGLELANWGNITGIIGLVLYGIMILFTLVMVGLFFEFMEEFWDSWYW